MASIGLIFFRWFCNSETLMASTKEIRLHLLIIEVFCFRSLGKLPPFYFSFIELFYIFRIFFPLPSSFTSPFSESPLPELGFSDSSDAKDRVDFRTDKFISSSSYLKDLTHCSKVASFRMAASRKQATFLSNFSLGITSILG